MVKAVFLDFYGTVVHEDGGIINIINNRIMKTGISANQDDIRQYWWNSFQNLFLNSYGDTFETQRVLEKKSLADTIHHFKSSENVNELSELLFEGWIKPSAFKESKEFFEKCPVPVYIVSNIDRADIEAAIMYHGFTPTKVFTSEDAKSYKPRRELFELALKNTGFTPDEVVHIGDSLSSDIKGAGDLGVNTIWINRINQEFPIGIITVHNLLEIFETPYFR